MVTCSELEEFNELVTQKGRDIKSAVASQVYLTALPSEGLREGAREPTTLCVVHQKLAQDHP